MPDESPPLDTAENAPEQQEASVGRVPVPTQAQLDARRVYRRAIRRSRNPFRFSLRSLALTLFLVIVTVTMLFSLVFALRGESVSPSLEPVIEVVAAPISLNGSDSSRRSSEPESSPSASVQTILAVQTPENPVLTGPPLPTVVITNTPVPLTIGVRAAVHDVGNDELNVRNVPSLIDSKVLFRAAQGTVFDIIGGPQEADGFTWWKVYDSQLQVEGWAVAIYLQTVPAESG